jgi:hypothetical protein
MTAVKNRLAALGLSLYEGVASEEAGELAAVLMWSLLGLYISATVFFPNGLPLG